MKKDQLICRELEISDTSCEVFSRLSTQPWAIFLDSANSEHINNRFDIISIKPVKTIETRDGYCFINNGLSQLSPFELLNAQMQFFDSLKAPFDLPFSGGLLGHFSYDLGRYLEKINNTASNDISLPDMAVGLYPDALIFAHKTNKWFYIAQPNYNRHALYERYLAQTDQSVNAKFKLASPWQSNMTKSQYTKKFNTIQNYIKSGDCYQINLAQRFSAQYQGSPWHAYLKLREENKAPFSAYINHPNGCILSVSPERFIQIKDRAIETKPIKGTLPRSSNPIIDKNNALTLAHSEKDRAENVMIVDLLRNDLGKVAAPGSVKVPALFKIESFPAVHHLVSTVTAQLAENKTAVDQLEAAFPGGSITGAPKIRAMQIIEELEPHRRSIYCGSIGYLSSCGNMDTSITIRTLICDKKSNKIHCWAGGGIVADSTAEAEYQETLDKVRKILPVLSKINT
ncbi:aminodeoxychorismate synthase, component I [Pseudoalteromonas sp. NBT06-2]|uniref:aminodeoxychorismate synthase component I n=1 Tax=Pseudoalteromonas sp. NBT06-2 TaxID=2025950 RepID=UPI000BA6A7DD|nr:aminodeoxychorismate synthase component I [Pseudoalteromonas sp. NBT06-2]PAJ73924.1 aminodeoxychorismate synthase, component I [Pseudoalteromonas sp. NBT06-2]